MLSGLLDLEFKIAVGQMGLKRQQGPGQAGPWDYIAVFGFLSSGLQRTTARGD